MRFQFSTNRFGGMTKYDYLCTLFIHKIYIFYEKINSFPAISISADFL